MCNTVTAEISAVLEACCQPAPHLRDGARLMNCLNCVYFMAKMIEAKQAMCEDERQLPADVRLLAVEAMNMVQSKNRQKRLKRKIVETYDLCEYMLDEIDPELGKLFNRVMSDGQTTADSEREARP